jgi:GT2 family glycosyltransferase
MSIGVVIPTYNRRDNLLLAISALAHQTYQNFYLVVSDNGSSDGTREAIAALKQTATWQRQLIWVEFVPERDHYPSRACNRNKGVAHLPPECTLICFLDSDIILNPAALAQYVQAHAAQPDALILGVVDWLPPLVLDEVKQLVKAGQLEALRAKIPPDSVKTQEGTFVGYEPRKMYTGRFTDNPAHVKDIEPKIIWAANLACPLTIWQKLGGFDEGIVEYGAEDVEFGYQARKQGISCLHYTPVWALHIWHPKAASEAVQANNHKNLGYVAQKHGLEAFIPSMAKTDDSISAKLNAQQPGRQLSDEQKMALALKLRQKRQNSMT